MHVYKGTADVLRGRQAWEHIGQRGRRGRVDQEGGRAEVGSAFGRGSLEEGVGHTFASDTTRLRSTSMLVLCSTWWSECGRYSVSIARLGGLEQAPMNCTMFGCDSSCAGTVQGRDDPMRG